MRRQPCSQCGKKVLAIIPARGGSKGIPKKNIRLLAGKPLLEYTIDAAKNSNELHKIVVSTDNPEIGSVAENAGIDVIIRPPELAQDTSPIIDTVSHVMTVLKEREGFLPDVIVLLQPTSPLRTTEDIDGAIRAFLTGVFDSVISVCETDHSPYWCCTLAEQKLKPLFNKKLSTSRRQDLPHTYRPNGAIFITSPDSLKRYSGFITRNTGPFIMPGNRSIDIDTPMDLQFVNLLISGMKKSSE